MANATFRTTMDYPRHRASCRITCGGCGYVRLADPPLLVAWFPMPLPIKEAERRLKCHCCGEKKARMVPVPMPGR